MDRDYGAVTAEKVAELQTRHGLEADGHFGPQTRKVVKDTYGFDFEAACRTISETTVFMQPDGTTVLW